MNLAEKSGLWKWGMGSGRKRPHERHGKINQSTLTLPRSPNCTTFGHDQGGDLDSEEVLESEIGILFAKGNQG